MDMNQLFYHHQMALMEKAAARRAGLCTANVDLRGHYAKRIEEYRARRGLETYFRDDIAAR
ncbi:hypothetical protein [Sphingopyxis fribergensis]